MNYIDEINNFQPKSLQEEKDKQVMLDYIRMFPLNILTRENEFAHFTGSSMIFNQDLTKVLMVYHNIYQSWSWTGGHADGDTDLYRTALREAKEETGLQELTPLRKEAVALDILPVWGHMKRGLYVSAHEHLNLTYLFSADEADSLKIKSDENSDVAWIAIEQLDKYVNEKNMMPVYEKMIHIMDLGI